MLGTSRNSNASEPYLARLDAEGNFTWEETVPLSELTHCYAGAVAFTTDGGSLGAINCGPFWVRSYAADGAVRWERRFAQPAAALLGMPDGGYVVALADGSATLRRFDAQHRLLWEHALPGCVVYNRLALENEGVLAMAACQEGYALSWLGDP